MRSDLLFCNLLLFLSIAPLPLMPANLSRPVAAHMDVWAATIHARWPPSCPLPPPLLSSSMMHDGREATGAGPPSGNPPPPVTTAALAAPVRQRQTSSLPRSGLSVHREQLYRSITNPWVAASRTDDEDAPVPPPEEEKEEEEEEDNGWNGMQGTPPEQPRRPPLLLSLFGRRLSFARLPAIPSPPTAAAIAAYRFVATACRGPPPPPGGPSVAADDHASCRPPKHRHRRRSTTANAPPPTQLAGCLSIHSPLLPPQIKSMPLLLQLMVTSPKPHDDNLTKPVKYWDDIHALDVSR
jgi:hypothetical protein